MRNKAEQLKKYKENVVQSHEYWKKNFERYHRVRNFVFNSNLTADDISALQTLQKPTLEFNFLEAYISRLMGEFSKQMPSVTVTNSEVYNSEVPAPVLKAVEGNLRYILRQGNTHRSFMWHIMRDLYSGGFSVAKIWHDYASQYSFDTVLNVERVFDPTLCGFDPLAKLADKSDGEYAFQLYPMRKEEFMIEYPKADMSQIKFVKDNTGFNWSYQSQKDDIVLICDYYSKRKKKIKIYKLANEQILEEGDYEAYIEMWKKEHPIEQVPVIVNERMTVREIICRTVFVENEELDYEELKHYPCFPLKFIDGNSIVIRETPSSAAYQMTRPYVYHAMDIQRLKNFAGQTLANELENITQTKVKMAYESILPQYKDAYTDIQKASVWIYQAYKDNDPDKQLPPPMEVQRAAIPPEVMGTFANCEQTCQMILGSYDAALGINDNQLSGVAIVEAATQSNAAAMPYIEGCMVGLNSILQMLSDMMPFYMNNKRTIPVMDGRGQQDSVEINGFGPDAITFNYPVGALKIKVEAGQSYQIQQNKTLQQIEVYSKAFPMFSALMNDPSNLQVLLDNMDFNGVDMVKESAPRIIQQLMQQQQSQPNPMQMKLQLEQQKMQQQMQLNAAKMQQQNVDSQRRYEIDQRRNELQDEQIQNEKLRLLYDAEEVKNEQIVQMTKADTERQVHREEHDLKVRDMAHKHAKDIALHHSEKP